MQSQDVLSADLAPKHTRLFAAGPHGYNVYFFDGV